MSRPILFRGKSVDNSEWVEGYYVKYGWCGQEKDYIVPICASALYAIEVIPSTVGQFTGLTDKNGVKIFEGDVVECIHAKNGDHVPKHCYDVQTKDGYWCDQTTYKRRYKVEWWNPQSDYRVIHKNIFFKIKPATISSVSAIVIGNIHDNPELGGDEND